MTTQAELLPFNDPDDLLASLGRIGPGDRERLRDSVAALVQHQDEDVREEALRVLLVKWKDGSYRHFAVAAIRSRAPIGVRTVSAYGLAATSSEATRQQDRILLLTVLEDRQEPLPVRAASYDALLIIERRPSFPSKKQHFAPDRDVDWDWIASLHKTISDTA